MTRFGEIFGFFPRARLESLTTDDVLRFRRRCISLVMVGMLLWYGAFLTVTHGFGAALPGGGLIVLGVLAVLGFVVFALAMVGILTLPQRLTSAPMLKAALGDEWSKAQETKAFMQAFWVLIVYLSLMQFVPERPWLSHVLTVQIGVLVGITACFVAFLLLDRPEAEDDGVYEGTGTDEEARR